MVLILKTAHSRDALLGPQGGGARSQEWRSAMSPGRRLPAATARIPFPCWVPGCFLPHRTAQVLSHRISHSSRSANLSLSGWGGGGSDRCARSPVKWQQRCFQAVPDDCVFTETDNTGPPFPSTQHYTMSPSSVRVLITDSPGLYTQSQSTENKKKMCNKTMSALSGPGLKPQMLSSRENLGARWPTEESIICFPQPLDGIMHVRHYAWWAKYHVT